MKQTPRCPLQMVAIVTLTVNTDGDAHAHVKTVAAFINVYHYAGASFKVFGLWQATSLSCLTLMKPLSLFEQMIIERHANWRSNSKKHR